MADSDPEAHTLKTLSSFTWEKQGEYYIASVERHPGQFLQTLKDDLSQEAQDLLKLQLIEDRQKVLMRRSGAEYLFKFFRLPLNLAESAKGRAR
jgi:hypothetical protein